MIDKIKQLAKKHGTKISSRTCYKDCAFNGKTIALYEDGTTRGVQYRKRRSDSNLIHDIAHFVVAAPERKVMPEFGLGPSPDSGVVFVPMADGMTGQESQEEEELASALGIYWERELGLDWRDTFEYHSWDATYLDMPDEEKNIFNPQAKHKFAHMLRRLIEMKIIQQGQESV